MTQPRDVAGPDQKALFGTGKVGTSIQILPLAFAQVPTHQQCTAFQYLQISLFTGIDTPLPQSSKCLLYSIKSSHSDGLGLQLKVLETTKAFSL